MLLASLIVCGYLFPIVSFFGIYSVYKGYKVALNVSKHNYEYTDLVEWYELLGCSSYNDDFAAMIVWVWPILGPFVLIFHSAAYMIGTLQRKARSIGKVLANKAIAKEEAKQEHQKWLDAPVEKILNG